MKILKVFILVLLSSSITASACGYYPFGEDIRYCFFHPGYFDFKSFSEFNYSSNYFEPGDIFDDTHNRPNDEAWFDYCKGKVSMSSIQHAVYELDRRYLNPKADNAMIQYLYRTRDLEAIEYLKFAKECELGNALYADPWERNEEVKVPGRNIYVLKAIENECLAQNPLIKERYIFLAIRLAFYDQDFDTVRELFDNYVKDTEKKGIIYYHSLYFRALAEKDAAKQSFMAAQVYAYAADKRFVVYTYFNREIPLEEILQFAKTSEERAAVYLLSAVRTPDRALAQIKGMYANNPGSEGLAFLLLRETNKIEDWVYTPYYSMFEPSVYLERYDEDNNGVVNNVLSRVAADKQYDQQLLNFINGANLSQVYNPQFWQLVKAQLEFVSNNYSQCLSTVKTLERNTSLTKKEQTQLQKIKALALTAQQPKGNAVILDEVKKLLYDNRGDSRFVFALGRELEYRGNTTDAAMLYSSLDTDYEIYTGEIGDATFWKSSKNRGHTFMDYYAGHISYIDAVYTPEQLKALIEDIKSNKKTDDFSVWKYSVVKGEIALLYDYLGMKYIRQDKLMAAAESFKKAGNAYWLENYSPWETGQSYGNQFDASPFYQVKYTADFIPVKEKYTLNKYTVTQKLIEYLNKANDPNERDRDYYYFLVANCYYNMTYHGNAWMMRRDFRSGTQTTTIIEDNDEFNECNLANQYYGLALKNAKTAKFRALCLRMQAKCAENKWIYSNGDYYYYGKKMEYSNQYYEKLEKMYPKYYKQLAGSCTYFEDYFKARR